MKLIKLKEIIDKMIEQEPQLANKEVFPSPKFHIVL